MQGRPWRSAHLGRESGRFWGEPEPEPFELLADSNGPRPDVIPELTRKARAAKR
jgi:hypothetical protein